MNQWHIDLVAIFVPFGGTEPEDKVVSVLVDDNGDIRGQLGDAAIRIALELRRQGHQPQLVLGLTSLNPYWRATAA